LSTTLIQLFAKPPVAGKVKTRLIPDIGVKSATSVYQHCLMSTLRLVKNSPFKYQIWLTESSDNPLFENEEIMIQQGHDLGERMFHALSSAFSQHHEKAILIGSDCLDLTSGILQRVCDKLQQHDLVLVPAEDGGYVLIAAKHSIHPSLFQGIEWSSELVLKQTLDRAQTAGIKTFVFNPLRDIDHIDDLQHYAELRQYL